MKKIIFLLLMIFIINKSFSQATVYLKNLKVNGQMINSQTINFNGNQTVDLTFDVEISTSNGSTNNVFGNFYLFFTSANFQTPYQIGFQAVTFLPPFGDQTKYTCTFYSYSITLNKSNFTSAGGTFYGQYKNNNGSTYNSQIFTVIDNTGGTNPGVPGTPQRGIELVPFGGIPIIKKLPEDDDWFTYKWCVFNSPYQPITISQNGPLYHLQDNLVNIIRFNKQTNEVDLVLHGPENEYMLYFETPFKFDSYQSHKQITISNNITSNDQYLTPSFTSTGIPILLTPSKITGNQASVSRIGSYTNTLQNFNVNNYQWQRRRIRPYILQSSTYPEEYYQWEDIPYAINADYTPTLPKTGQKDAMKYRRLVIDEYRNEAAASEEIAVYPISISSTINNSVCCDAQYHLGETTNPIIGSTPVMPMTDNGRMKFKYQWQIGTTRNGSISWKNIENAHTKDFLPYKLSGMRSTEVNKYRRMIITGDYKFYLSEPVEITWYHYASSQRIAQTLDKNPELEITVYPNPTSSKITIEDKNDLSSFNVKIVDINGKILISKEPNSIEINSLEMDLTSIPSGIYTLILENSSNTITKKIIKK